MRRTKGGEKKKLSTVAQDCESQSWQSDVECIETELKANMTYKKPYLKKLKNKNKANLKMLLSLALKLLCISAYHWCVCLSLCHWGSSQGLASARSVLHHTKLQL